MPELPQIERFKNYLDQTALNQKITHVEVVHPKVLQGSEKEINQILVGQSFQSSQRWGKNLFVTTNQGQDAIMHFGMTGFLEYYHRTREAPKYSRVVFEFETEFNLSYVSKRMFGRLGLISSVAEYVKEKSLAPDAMLISLPDFTGNVLKRKKNIKAVLLDQQTAAGVGNWIADEILYQAKIHPSSPSRHLSEKQIASLYEHMQEIITTDIAGESIRENLPSNYITKYDRKTTITCPGCNNEIEKTVVAGRGTYACGTCQVTY